MFAVQMDRRVPTPFAVAGSRRAHRGAKTVVERSAQNGSRPVLQRRKLERLHFRCSGSRSVENSCGTPIP
jgi:hypothetical protein